MLARAVHSAFPPPSLPNSPRPTSALVYFPAPERDHRLHLASLRVWNTLARRGAMDSWLAFSPSRLAIEMDMSRNAMFTALKELKDLRYIQRGRQGRLTSVLLVPAPLARRVYQ